MAQPDSVTWIGDLFAAIDAKDTGRFVAFLTPQGEFRFGSSPPVRGREQVAAAVDGFFSTIAGLGHRVDRTWQGENSVVCEGEVTYRRHDGSAVTLPFTDVFDMDGDKIARYRIYIDAAPLYEN
ncbi:MAG: nuclear transport factor 2 family protein [Gammaproteobacteria bacterium]|nr:nuclear transport factor 2 family protein [Gammaproteobacteria bacterium]